MKRKIALLLAFAMVLSMAACNPNSLPAANGNLEEPSSAQNSSVASDPSQEAPKVDETAREIAWDVSRIYPDMKAFEAEFSQAESQIEPIAAMSGKLGTVEAVVNYFSVCDKANWLISRLSAYASQMTYKDQSDNDAKGLLGRIDNLSAKFSTATAFAMPELFANSSDFLDAVAKDERMKPYLLWFNREREQSKHTLPEREEQLIQPIYQLKNGANSLYDSLAENDIEFQTVKFPDGVEHTANYNNYSLSLIKSYPQEFRAEFYNTMMKPYRQFRNTFAQNLHNYYTAVTTIADFHKYDSALEESLASRDIPVSVYEGALAAADQAKPVLDRFYSLLKKSLNVTDLYYFEPNVSIADAPDIGYTYEDSQKLIKEALSPLGSDYVAKLDEMFAGNTIDVYPASGKNTGGSCTTVPGSLPYVLLNYVDDFDSCSTMALSLGYAVHTIYAKTQESTYAQSVSSQSSEIASNLNELLLSDYMIENAKTDKERQYYAAQQITLLYNRFFKQASYAYFQESIAKEVENGGTLTADRLDELWSEAMTACLGSEFDTTSKGSEAWMQIPHFYMGFYVYQYVVGISAACNIADRIQTGDKDAAENYISFLKAGDSENITDLLKGVGVDLSDSSYITALTDRFERLIAEFE